MNIEQLFLERYNVLCEFWLGWFWENMPEQMMRTRPHPLFNSIAWNLWHIARVEDIGLNRFVAVQPQVFDENSWMQRLNLPWRHHGAGMTLPEVDELNQTIDLGALREYAAAVQARTREILAHTEPEHLAAVLQPAAIHAVLFDEGAAHPQAAGLAETYAGWTKGRCLMNFGLTHPYQHVGVMGTLARLHGVEY